MCNVYYRFVPNLARAAALLNVQTRKNQPSQFDLKIVEIDAFQDLKERLMTPPILALSRREQRYTLETDGCDHQIGRGFFQQQPDGVKHFVGYWSISLSAAEKAYFTTENECLAAARNTTTL